jgi:beta-alanine--pyruvate transaminase
MTAPRSAARDQMEAFWMPFTANRQFKANPRMLARPKACTTGRPMAGRSSMPWRVFA